MYKSLIRPVVSYGSETWVFNQKSADILDMFERKVLRRIFQPVNEGGQWRMRRKEELWTLYQEASLSTFVRLQSLRLYEHIRRMGEERLAERLFGHILLVPGEAEGLETDGPMQWGGIWEVQGCVGLGDKTICIAIDTWAISIKNVFDKTFDIFYSSSEENSGCEASLVALTKALALW